MDSRTSVQIRVVFANQIFVLQAIGIVLLRVSITFFSQSVNSSPNYLCINRIHCE